MASAAVRWPPPVPEPLPGRARTVATRPQRREGADSPSLPSRFHPRHRRSRSHGHRSPAFTLPPAAFESRLPPGGSAFGTFGAERRRGNLREGSIMRTDAQSCAQIESPRARVPYTARVEFSLPTVLRGSAHTAYWQRFLGAYGYTHFGAGAPHRTSRTKSSAAHTDRCHDAELRTALGPSQGGDIGISPIARTCEHLSGPRADTGGLRCAYSSLSEMRICFDESVVPGCERKIPDLVPKRLPPPFTNRQTSCASRRRALPRHPPVNCTSGDYGPP